MLAYVIPTRNRPERLAATLEALGALSRHTAQVIVVDNASDVPPRVPVTLANGLPTEVVFLNENRGAAARNAGVAAADPACQWVVMLDDDSHPIDTGFLAALAEAPADAAAIAAEITLPEQGRREAGGLPEVFTGCGVAIRPDAFLAAKGYDPAFDYYAEEYDLAAKFLLAGHRIMLDRRFRVAHHKVASGRDMNRILRRLVRNNAWVMQRYAPDDRRRVELRETIVRYARIAHLERATPGYLRGLAETAITLRRQPRTPMPADLFDRFTGKAYARESLQRAFDAAPFTTAAIVHEGKNARHIREAACELGVSLIDDALAADRLIIGTLSPGPMLDAYERLITNTDPARVIAPWDVLLAPPQPQVETSAPAQAA
jgi:GT2 family glycosyltransferase